MELYPIIKNGRETLPPVQLAMQERYFHSLKDGTQLKKTYTKMDKAGSLKQGGLHFGLVVEMIRQRLYEMRIDVCGVPVNKEMVHDILKKACGGVGDNGEQMNFRDMSTTQRSKFFDNCRTWCATQLSLVIPDPQKDWKEKKNNVDKA